MMQLAIVAIAVADQATAIKFYTERVGCTLENEHDTHDGRHWALLQLPAGPTRIALVQPSPAMPAGSTRGLILRTLDLDNAAKRLSERGLAISTISSASWGRYATFADPDGNGWMLAESHLRHLG